MRVTMVLGSPRPQSNSAKLAEAAASAFSGPGHEIRRHVLHDLKVKGCQGCWSCKGRTEFCVIKDDLTEVLFGAAESDVVIVSGPIYVGDVSAQLKAFIDRTFSWYKPDYNTNPRPSRLVPGKAMALILTQGDPEPKQYEHVLRRYAGWFGSHGFDVKAMSASGLHDGDVAVTDPELVAAASGLLLD